MSKFRVTLITTASASIEVEADDRDDAIDAAFEKVPSICAKCGGWGEDYGLELGDFDVPTDEDGKEADWAAEEVS